MNDILKKRIEEEADAYSFENAWYPGETSYESDIREMEQSFASAFSEGARFALSNQWISVEEALPELMERVLVAYRLMNKISVCIMKRIPHDSADPNNGKWHWSLVNHKKDVIAWMPIPKFDN